MDNFEPIMSNSFSLERRVDGGDGGGTQSSWFGSDPTTFRPLRSESVIPVKKEVDIERPVWVRKCKFHLLLLLYFVHDRN